MNGSSLYTNIPHDEEIIVIREILVIHRPPYDLPHSSNIAELFKVFLIKDYFDFNGENCHQISGTSIGTKLAPSYANAFRARFVEHVQGL